MSSPKHPRRRPWWRLATFVNVVALVALALGAVMALAMGCTPSSPARASRGDLDAAGSTGADDDPVRIKGLVPRLSVHRQRDGRIERLRDGDVARAGDLIQMSYVAAGNRNGVIVSIDGRGTVTLHHPERPDGSPTLVARGEHALDHAYELDDARSYERFVLVTAGDEPLSPRIVLDAARRLAQRGPAARHCALALPERWQQSSITLSKQPERP